jgi:hypothetical protein
MSCEDKDKYIIKNKSDEDSDVLCVGECGEEPNCDICCDPVTKINVNDISFDNAKNNYIAAAALKEAAAADLVSAQSRAILRAACGGDDELLAKIAEFNNSLETLLPTVTAWEMTTGINISELIK